MVWTVVPDVLIIESENVVPFTLDLVPFKAAVTLATDKVDINGLEPMVESFVTVKCIILLNVNGMVVDKISETRIDSRNQVLAEVQ